MNFSELARDTTADARVKAPEDDYPATVPDDNQATGLVDERSHPAMNLGERDNEALATRRIGDLAVKRAEDTGNTHGDDLQFSPVIPQQRARVEALDEPEADEKPDTETDESARDERLEIDGGVNEVVLKELELADAERIVKLVAFDTEHFTSVGETTPEVAGSVESVQTWLSGMQTSVPEGWDRRELGIWHRDEMVGCTGYAAKDDHAYLWNWVGKEHTGHGYGGDSIQTLVPHLLQNGHTVIEARVREDNGASRRNMQKTGFEPIDQQHDYIRYRFAGQDADPSSERQLEINQVGN